MRRPSAAESNDADASRPRVLMRVDASQEMGSGHVVRCLALSVALRRTGAECVFVSTRLPSELEALVRAAGNDVIRLSTTSGQTVSPFCLDEAADAEAVASLLRAHKFESVLVDHYGISYEWERRVRPFVSKIVVLDELADRCHDADILIDQGIDATRDKYANLLARRARLLLGPRYALLRPEFASLRERALSRARDGIRRVVVFTGGGDVINATGLVLDAWSRLEAARRPKLDVVVGARSRHLLDIERRCNALEGVTLHVQTPHMAELLAAADLLIGSAGTTSWERCCLGVPGLMFAVAENQLMNLRTLAARRTGIDLGPAHALTSAQLLSILEGLLSRPTLLARMGTRGARLVDGLGALRVAAALAGDRVALRSATEDDVRLAYEWRNHPSTRRYSRDPAPIAFESHSAWWRCALENSARILLIAHIGDLDVGVLRLDVDGDSAEISIYLDPSLTGLGLGSCVLRAGQGWVRAHLKDLRRLVAEIVSGNTASEKIFVSAGFVRHGRDRWSWDVLR